MFGFVIYSVARFFTSEHICSQVTLDLLFPSETGTIEIETIFPKLNWHDCYQLTLAQLFQSGF